MIIDEKKASGGNIYASENKSSISKSTLLPLLGFKNVKTHTDHLVRLDVHICFVKHKHMVGICFDPEQANDTTWKYKTRVCLMGTPFLFEVRCDNTYTSLKLQEKGVLQGSILSPTLLPIQINSVVKAMPVFPFLSSG